MKRRGTTVFMDAKRAQFQLTLVAGAMFALPFFTINHRMNVAPAQSAQAAMTPMAVPSQLPLAGAAAPTDEHAAIGRIAAKPGSDREPTQPLDNMRITSPFGSRMHPILHRVENHPGIDLGATLNDPIHAVFDGVVSSAGWRGGYGNAVEIYHPRLHESTLYGHMNAIEVRAGQQVAEGQIIGLAGTTGLSTGVHLHFGVLRNGEWTDPIAFLDSVQGAPASTAMASAPAPPRSYRPILRRASQRSAVQLALATSASKATRRLSKATDESTARMIQVAAAPTLEKPKEEKPKVDTVALRGQYTAAAKAAQTWSQLYETGAVSRNDRDAKMAAAESLQVQLKAAKAG